MLRFVERRWLTWCITSRLLWYNTSGRRAKSCFNLTSMCVSKWTIVKLHLSQTAPYFKANKHKVAFYILPPLKQACEWWWHFSGLDLITRVISKHFFFFFFFECKFKWLWGRFSWTDETWENSEAQTSKNSSFKEIELNFAWGLVVIIPPREGLIFISR